MVSLYFYNWWLSSCSLLLRISWTLCGGRESSPISTCTWRLPLSRALWHLMVWAMASPRILRLPLNFHFSELEILSCWTRISKWYSSSLVGFPFVKPRFLEMFQDSQVTWRLWLSQWFEWASIGADPGLRGGHEEFAARSLQEFKKNVPPHHKKCPPSHFFQRNPFEDGHFEN